MLKEEYVLEASYNKDFEKIKKERDRDRKNRQDKKNIRVYGYKYHKVLQFLAQINKCLKDCFEKRFESLNVDMNYFLLLKNELSLAFLRKFDNIVSTVKAAIRIYASKEEQSRKDSEALELAALEKIIKSQLAVAGRDIPPAQIADLGVKGAAYEEGKEPVIS